MGARTGKGPIAAGKAEQDEAKEKALEAAADKAEEAKDKAQEVFDDKKSAAADAKKTALATSKVRACKERERSGTRAGRGAVHTCAFYASRLTPPHALDILLPRSLP